MKSSERYSSPAIALHWLIAGLIIATFIAGLLVSGLPLSPAKFKYIAWHKWAGITILALVAVRLLVRLLKRPPALPAHMNGLERLLAHGGHLALYLLMFAVPLTGWLMSSAYGFPVVLFKLVQLPDLVAQNEQLAATLKTVHETLNWIMAACVAGHVLAAIKHHVIDKDGMLYRMSLRGPRE
ncbi:cytochrome b [Aquitalea palustris]|uniref:Cytochrome b n=2 Tax=Pseudomonadota TaxID=1224 RepID=A0A454JP42_9NEIS|nr:cytochrome b [Aquitalea palustris]RMD02241.1 cytochrome b [Aquitalea palustris]